MYLSLNMQHLFHRWQYVTLIHATEEVRSDEKNTKKNRIWRLKRVNLSLKAKIRSKSTHLTGKLNVMALRHFLGGVFVYNPGAYFQSFWIFRLKFHDSLNLHDFFWKISGFLEISYFENDFSVCRISSFMFSEYLLNGEWCDRK